MTTQKTSAPQFSRIAFWFWTLSLFKTTFALLFFRSNPAVATGLGAVVSVAFAYFVVIRVIGAKDLTEINAFPAVIKWIGLYLVWCALSLCWTRSASPTSALGYWGVMVADVFVAVAMLRWGNVELIAVESLKGIVAGGVLISFCALLTKSDDPNGRLGDLEFLHPGNVGKFAGEAALCGLFLWFKSRTESEGHPWLWSFSSLFLGWIVLRSLSKTSIVALLCALVFYIVCSRWIRLKQKILVLVVGTVLVAGMYTLLNTYLDTYFEETPNDASTLTGRTVLWIESWNMITEHPIAGYGFISFRDYGPQDWEVRTTHAHNEWITQWFQLGLVGLLVAVLIYCSYFHQVRRSPRSPQRELALSMLIYMLIQGFAIAEPTGLMFPLPMMLMLSTWCHSGISSPSKARSDARRKVLGWSPANC